MRPLSTLLRDNRGATAIEYGLICALIFLSMVAGISSFGRSLTNMLTNVATKSGAVM